MHLIIKHLISTSKGGLMMLLMLTFGIHMGNAQHCTPGFHVTIDEYTVQFDDQSTADGDITDYSWDFGDGQTSNEQNPVHTYSAAGTYNVCLTITVHNPGCTATFCHHVVIHDPPPGDCHAAFTVHQPDHQSLVIDFTDQSTSDGNITSWSWDFGDGNSSSAQHPTHTYPAAGTYLVCLHITDDTGCTDHFCHEVIVHDPPPGHCQAAYTYHQPDINEPVIEFTDQSTSDGTIIYWSWNFANGPLSVQQHPTVTFPGPGTYNVCLYIADDTGCTSEFCHDVVIHAAPPGECHASFSVHPSDSTSLTMHFTNLSTSDGHITSWLWEFGEGGTSIEANPTYTYQHAGTYLVCLFIADDAGCTAHFCHHVVVEHTLSGVCHALFAAHQMDQTELTIHFTDLSTADDVINTWLWDFGDGSTSGEQNPTHTYLHAGTYLVCLFITTEDGCTSHYCHHVTLHPVPADVDNSAQMLGLQHSHGASGFDQNQAPLHFRLDDQDVIESDVRIYPNPIYGEATVTFILFVDAEVRLEIYDMKGAIMMKEVFPKQGRGLINLLVQTENLQTGAYFVRVIAGDEVVTKPLVVLK